MPKPRKRLRKETYEKVGSHSAVQLCNWTKKSLKNEGVCFKEEFYGIKSHLCCQMTPSIFCNNRCIHCWRDTTEARNEMISKPDEPKKIIDDAIKAQRKLLSGFGIDKNSEKKQLSKADLKKFEEAQNPKNFTFSLTGEPTLYPKLGELIREVHSRNATSFLVTNGLQPEVIEKLVLENNLPTRLVVTVNSSDEKDYSKFHNSLKKDAWKNLTKTLEIISKIKKKNTIIRINLIREINMEEKNVKEFAEIIAKTNPFIVGIKAYMPVGFARERLGYEKAPTFDETLDFAKKLEKQIDDENYKIVAVHKPSRYFILSKNKEDLKIKKEAY